MAGATRTGWSVMVSTMPTSNSHSTSLVPSRHRSTTLMSGGYDGGADDLTHEFRHDCGCGVVVVVGHDGSVTGVFGPGSRLRVGHGGGRRGGGGGCDGGKLPGCGTECISGTGGSGSTSGSTTARLATVTRNEPNVNGTPGRNRGDATMTRPSRVIWNRLWMTARGSYRHGHAMLVPNR